MSRLTAEIPITSTIFAARESSPQKAFITVTWAPAAASGASSADIAKVWRRVSVVASWLLDLTAISLLEQPTLERFSGRVSDSGEGRWTLLAAIESTAPAPVLSASLYQRFTSRGEDDFAAKVLSAMRFQFGGHIEKKAGH